MPSFKPIKAGTRFGRLVVVGDPIREKYKLTKYRCACDCGAETVSVGSNLTFGSATSCGCARNETLSKLKTTHGKSKTRLHNMWCGMKARCSNKNHDSYKNYGAKGIKVGVEFSDFARFEAWALKSGYKRGLTIERKNNNLGYSPSNCKWADYTEQNRNSSHVHKVFYNGQNLCLQEWSEKTGIPAPVIRRRLKDGWTVERSLTKKSTNKK